MARALRPLPLVASAATLQQILRLEVPIVVQLGARTMRVSDVIRLLPGSILELTKNADAELDILVNNQTVGSGCAVKVGENFGIRITHIGDSASRLSAMGVGGGVGGGGGRGAEMSPEQMAEALLAGRM